MNKQPGLGVTMRSPNKTRQCFRRPELSRDWRPKGGWVGGTLGSVRESHVSSGCRMAVTWALHFGQMLVSKWFWNKWPMEWDFLGTLNYPKKHPIWFLSQKKWICQLGSTRPTTRDGLSIPNQLILIKVKFNRVALPTNTSQQIDSPTKHSTSHEDSRPHHTSKKTLFVFSSRPS